MVSIVNILVLLIIIASIVALIGLKYIAEYDADRGWSLAMASTTCIITSSVSIIMYYLMPILE